MLASCPRPSPSHDPVPLIEQNLPERLFTRIPQIHTTQLLKWLHIQVFTGRDRVSC